MKNEVGNRYGKLTVLSFDHMDKKHNAYFLCKCDCGCTSVVKGNRLRSGKTKSCGCLIREHGKELGSKYGKENAKWLPEFNRSEEHRRQASKAATTHGDTNTRLFRIWGHMKDRCNRAKGDHAKWYHEKGIRVCDEWEHDYPAFKEWAFKNGYEEQPKGTPLKEMWSIDRIDPDKGYSPDNCRWVSFSENSKLRNQYHANQR